jgi:phosphonoacetaldehyde hydrolase
MSVPRIRLVVFDWAGTTVDHGCFAPLAPFIEAFAAFGVTVTAEQARRPMGLPKKDHLRAIAEIPEIAQAWRNVHGRPISHADIDELYDRRFVPLQLESVHRHCELIPGLLDCVESLRRRGIKMGTTTGYFREAANACYEEAARQGYRPDHNVCPDDVSAGRPAPWMIFRNMEALDVYPPEAVLKVGDTAPDILEGRNAGAWSVGVTCTSSEVGCSLDQWQRLDESQRRERLRRAEQTLRSAGAHAVIESVADVPELIDQIESGQARRDGARSGL